MRSISDALRARFESSQQTKANNADPRLSVLISRNTAPLTDPTYLESSLILTTSGLTACSVAVRRPVAYGQPDRVHVAYLDQNGAHVKSAALAASLTRLIWRDEPFSAPDAVDVSIVFDGREPLAPDGTAQFVTDARPWVFWVTSSGVLKGRILGLLGDVTLAASNAQKVSAIRATWTQSEAGDFGLVVFFLLGGQLYYRQLIKNDWKDAELVQFGPPGVTWTDVAAFRTLDYRIGVQGLGSDGKVYELFSQFQGIAKHAEEHIELTARAVGKLDGIRYIHEFEREHVAMNASAAPGLYGGLYRAGAPIMLSAENIEVDGAWNTTVRVVFDRHLVAADVAAQPTRFCVVDSNGRVFIARTATLLPDGLTVELGGMTLSNAEGTCALRYTPGTVRTMAGAALPELAVSFTPTHLTPGDDPPAPVSVSNTGNTTVTVVFDGDVSAVASGLAPHFALSFQIGEYAPGGPAVPASCAASAVLASDLDTLTLTFPDAMPDTLGNALGDAVLSYDGAGELSGAGGWVQPFDVSFSPSGLTPRPDQAEHEHIELSVAASGDLWAVTWHETQTLEHLELSVAASGTLTHVDDL